MQFIITLLVLLVLPAPIVAQTDENTAVTDVEPLVNYYLSKDDDGKWILKRAPDSPEIQGQPGYWSNVWTNLPLARLDWYVSKSPKGEVNGIWAGNLQEASPATFFNNSPEGSKFSKVDYPEALTYIGIFDPEDAQKKLTNDIKEALILALETTQEQVCRLSVLPSKVEVSADVEISLGVGGSIGLSLEWDTKDLCKGK